MKTRLYVFEDDDYEHFYPLTVNRPVYTLLCGAFPLWQKWKMSFPGADLGFFCRGDLASSLREQTNMPCNRFNFNDCDRVVFINGRVLPDHRLIQKLSESTGNQIFLTDGNLTAVTLSPDSDAAAAMMLMNYWGYGHFKSVLKNVRKTDIASIRLNYIWDFITHNPSRIIADYQAYAEHFRRLNNPVDKYPVDECIIYNPENVLISHNAQIDGSTVLDARHGAIIIADNVYIAPHTRIEGPCYIGPGCQLVGGRIREGCSFGPACRIGGEVEESIFLGYSNKYHDGFIGHAYLGEWVNLGALTTNSDLKNNYKEIRVNIGMGEQKTGLMKVGSFIGDHVKTGIGTLLNTGISIGFAANIFGGGLITDKFVPPFVWGGQGGYAEYRLDKAIETARAVMKRRDQGMTDTDMEMFKFVFNSNQEGRRDFLID